MEEQWLAFCPYCGADYPKRKTNPHLCARCHKEYYINPHPCNAVIIENEKKEIMMVRRKIAPQKGKWDLPGGFMNLGETAEDSVRREIREELGLEIPGFSYFSSYFDRYLYKGINYHTLCFFYLTRIKQQKMKAADDIKSYAFFSKDKLPFGTIAFNGITWVLKKYIKEYPIR